LERFRADIQTFPAQDPCEALEPRVKSRLRRIARILDNITAIIIHEHASGEIRAAALVALQGKGTGSPGQAPFARKEEMKAQLTARFPQLKAGANMAEVLAHISDTLVCEYWERISRDHTEVRFPMMTACQAIASSRDECLDAYECIQANLEEKYVEVLFCASDAIRLRLVALEPYLRRNGLQYRRLPKRKQNVRPFQTERSPKVRIITP
jgi:hypothetical protein